MDSNDNGKRIARLYWPPRGNGAQPESLFSAPGITIQYEEQNLGDHGIAWAVVRRDGTEIERHNLNYVESIVWE